jgi:DNA-directed RNA polymerase subunit RPC12/RpoP
MVGEFAMCRYAFKKYKPHYACLRCHKSFKRRLKEDVDPEGKDRPAQCPQCGLLLADMGLDFKPPPVSKAAAWNTVEALWVIGETFHSCGCNGPGFRPRQPNHLREFYKTILSDYRSHLDAWVKRAPGDERERAVMEWRGRIQKVTEALDGLA